MPITEKEYEIRDRYIHEYYETSTYTPYAEFCYIGYDRVGGYYPHLYPREIRGKIISNTNDDTFTARPDLGNIEIVINKIFQALEEKNTNEIARLLTADFILSYNREVTVKGIHLDIPSQIQGHYYTYQECSVRPTIEFLIQNHPNLFRNLLLKAEQLDNQNNTNNAEGLRHIIVQQLKDLDLQNTDLSHMNLEDADLSRSKLYNTKFAKTNLRNALFIKSNLIDSHISKKQLTDCKSYLDAKLSNDFWPYWTDATKQRVLSGLNTLRDYGTSLVSKGVSRGNEAVTLANNLTSAINHPDAKYNESFQKNFLKTLHSKDKLFENHRNYNRIIANIALCVVSGVVGYLVAGLINKYHTGNFTFFSKPKTQAKVEGIDSLIKRPVNSMEVFGMGLNNRLGKESNINKFFGSTDSKLHDPIGDVRVLRDVAAFLY